MSDSSGDRADYCYRHPDRRSFVLCQRCGRTICPECQVPAAVGVHCPECVRESQRSMPKRPTILTAVRRRTAAGAPVITYALIALCVVGFIAQYLTGGPDAGAATRGLIYAPWLTGVEPWRMVTALFLHGSLVHIALNMFSLYIFGPVLERPLGPGRFLALYLLSGLGGSLGVLLLSPTSLVLGASGAIFGLLGAFFVIQRRLGGGNSTMLLVVIGLNLAAGFIIPGIAWQAHVGGLVVGGLVALIFVKTRERRQQNLQILLLAGTLAAIIALTVAGVALLPVRLFG